MSSYGLDVEFKEPQMMKSKSALKPSLEPTCPDKKIIVSKDDPANLVRI